MSKRLSAGDRAANRARYLKSALGKPAVLTPRDVEVINKRDHFRVLVYDDRLPDGRFDTELKTTEEVYRFWQELMPEVRARVLIYAVWGQRSALVPPSRYAEFILLPGR